MFILMKIVNYYYWLLFGVVFVIGCKLTVFIVIKGE